MKFKALCKVLCAPRYELVVFDKTGNYVDSFVVDYTKEYDKDNVLRKIDLEDIATVKYVHVGSDGMMTVTVKV